jgi:hypothetical protein
MLPCEFFPPPLRFRFPKLPSERANAYGWNFHQPIIVSSRTRFGVWASIGIKGIVCGSTLAAHLRLTLRTPPTRASNTAAISPPTSSLFEKKMSQRQLSVKLSVKIVKQIEKIVISYNEFCLKPQ